MKSLSIYLSIVAFLATGLWANTALAKEFKRKIEKQYTATEQTLLEIENRPNGDVSIKDWDKDKIHFEIVIRVNTSSQEKAEKIFEKIEIDFAQEGNHIKAETQLSDDFNRVDYSVNYDVFVPKYIKLNLTNKFGDVFINELTGKSDITVKYGILRINKLLDDNSKPRSRIVLAYSNGSKIKQCNWLTVNMAHSKLTIDQSQALAIISKHSKLEAGQNSSLVAESKHDSYKLGELNNLVLEAGYSSVRADQINNKFILQTKYGSCKVGYIPQNFEEIKIEAKYTDVKIGIDQNAAYTLDAETKYGDIDFAQSDKNRLNKERQGTEYKVYGTVGGSNASAKVVVRTKYGKTDLD